MKNEMFSSVGADISYYLLLNVLYVYYYCILLMERVPNILVV